jgi:hypothetical protein
MRRITKRLIRDLVTGELIDAESVYHLIPLPDPVEPRRACTRHVVPPPGAREIRDQETDTLRYVFGDVPVQNERPQERRRDYRPLLAFAVPILIAVLYALWPLLQHWGSKP